MQVSKNENKNWKLVGILPTGEAVYCSDVEDYAKEKDYTYLVQMTAEELRSAMLKKPR